MQVVVTFEDQRTEVITLQDDLGVAKDDWPMIRKKLFLQGVRDVLHVEPKLQGDNREMSYRTS